jgi:predicted metal-dependent HD superfamily phosphohydrolase
MAGDNEVRSATLAKQCLSEAGMDTALTERVFKLVMATKTHDAHADKDTAIMVDTDLSILGQEEKRFFEYEAQIRMEYLWVPEKVFASKRAEILQAFLARENIFATEWFRQKYERQARKNLEASVIKLRSQL